MGEKWSGKPPKNKPEKKGKTLNKQGIPDKEKTSWGNRNRSGVDATPPPCRAPRCSYTPVAAHSAVLSVLSRGVAATPPPKDRCRTSLPATAGGCRGCMGPPKPCRTQGVEQLHCSVSRYNSPLRSKRGLSLANGGLAQRRHLGPTRPFRRNFCCLPAAARCRGIGPDQPQKGPGRP